MHDENKATEPCGDVKKRKKDYTNSGMVGMGYFVAFIAAAVYFIQQAETFWMGLLGFLKALVWPGYLVYYLLDFLKL
ncbi:MAG: hypothetical protein KAI62_04515 [Actinomycetia bacterium]|nr:hypothetical protein [Actinomycetes bacterium]